MFFWGVKSNGNWSKLSFHVTCVHLKIFLDIFSPELLESFCLLGLCLRIIRPNHLQSSNQSKLHNFESKVKANLETKKKLDHGPRVQDEVMKFLCI